jgi:hypothetical protein
VSAKRQAATNARDRYVAPLFEGPLVSRSRRAPSTAGTQMTAQIIPTTIVTPTLTPAAESCRPRKGAR